MVRLLPLLFATSFFLAACARERPSKGDRCFLAKVKVQAGNGKTYWETKEDLDTSQRDCNEFCANVPWNATGKAHNGVRSATCFKNDGKTNPYVDDKGKAQSDDMPVGTIVHGDGHCTCDDPMLNDFVLDFLSKALPAIGEITCKVWFTAFSALLTVGLASIPGLGQAGAAGVGVAAQAADVMVWTFNDRNEAARNYGDWVQYPSGNKSEIPSERPATGLMDLVCGNKYTPPDAEKILNTFQEICSFGTNFASAPKLFVGAAKSWPPPFARGAGNLGEALDFIHGLSEPPAST